MNQKRGGNGGYMSLKLDINKTYDRVECHFIEQVMRKMGFREEWIRKILMCIGLISFGVLINGKPSEPFRPLRGLRQGDLLSLYLFLLCTEGLTSLLSTNVDSNLLTSVKICGRASSLSHLLFANDIVLFYKANMQENRHIIRLLELYEQAARKCINKTKNFCGF